MSTLEGEERWRSVEISRSLECPWVSHVCVELSLNYRLTELRSIVGSFTDLHDNTIASGQSTDNPFGQTMEEIIVSHVPSNKPIHWNLPIGHGTKNVPVVLGATWESQMHRFPLEIP